MKRSEANEIIKNRIEFSKKYDCFSCISDEPYFSSYGCDCCNLGLAGDVYDITMLGKKDIKNKIFDHVLEGQVCSGCLCSLVNGDDSDLDYHVNEEDESKFQSS